MGDNEWQTCTCPHQMSPELMEALLCLCLSRSRCTINWPFSQNSLCHSNSIGDQDVLSDYDGDCDSDGDNNDNESEYKQINIMFLGASKIDLPF